MTTNLTDRIVEAISHCSRMLLPVFVLFSVTFSLPGLSADPTQPAVDFAREVLPVLSDNCFVCHGPDSHEETDLKLDSFAAATSDRGGYRAIDPGALNESELLARIFSDDDPMPPADAERQLTEEDRQILKRWIEQGGKYARHWAFVKPQKHLAFEDATSAIDELLSVRLREQGLEFAPEASPEVLARRVALVLTGLPPSAEIRDAFLANPTEDAYQVFVDRLLADSKYGEHQARYWLDAVRYGDTHGLHLDNKRGIYPYRDWVVRAMNQNLPIDDFFTWQMAGDLLEQPTLDQRVATGYVRLNPTTGEGGAIPDEFQMKNNFDRVETLGTVFLGMSLTCARCHTHKYDPIPQSEYYQLLAFFNSTAEPSMDRNAYEYGPTVKVPQDQAAWLRWQQLQKRANALIATAKLTAQDRKTLVEFATSRLAWKSENWKVSKLFPRTQQAVPAKNDGDAGWSDLKGLPGALVGRASRGKAPNADQQVFVSCELTVPQEQTIHLAFAGGIGSYVVLDDRNVPVFEKKTIDNAVVPLRLTAGTHKLALVIKGFSGNSELRVQLDNLWDSLGKGKDWGGCQQAEQLRMLASDSNPLAFRLDEKAKQLAVELVEAEARFTTTLVAKELPTPRETFVLRRGEYDLPIGDAVVPGTLAVMGELPTNAPKTRMGLANWLTSGNHPLVARVFINRVWQRTFGHGLVRTPEDFGLQGEQPTHPELLDWLAVDFQETDWDLKKMLRAMVMTKAFRQSSAWREDIDDPENRLFARATSYRLDAEMLRDMGLWASGLLDEHMGGEGVKPYQPAGMWLALAHPGSNTKNYVRDQGRPLYRRSLYVYWKRTSPHPMMTLFDAPDRESSCVRRSRTNTPLQSLGMLNETQRIEMGRGLAARVLDAAETESDRINHLFQLLTCRDAGDKEQKACISLIKQLRQRYSQKPDDAARLLAIGEAKFASDHSQVELAVWAQLATTVLASDVAILLY
ncbi:MAG: PSD1 and planctomycete cytochrome C domain-containing protein [Rubripirellula sp.]